MYLIDNPLGTTGALGSSQDDAGYAIYYFSKLSHLNYLSSNATSDSQGLAHQFLTFDGLQRREFVELTWGDFEQQAAESSASGDPFAMLTDEELEALLATSR